MLRLHLVFRTFLLLTKNIGDILEQNIFGRAVFFFFLVLFCISILLMGKLIAPFFATIILGIVFTGVFKPVFNFFLRKLSHRIASVLTCIIMFFVVFIPVFFFVGILSKEALNLYNMAKDAVFSNQLINLLENAIRI